MTKAMRLWLLLCGLLAAFSPTTAHADVAFTSDRVVITTDKGTVAFVVEMAVTQEQRQLGLMHRKGMAPDRGMLFDFGQEQRIAMWMKNTYLALDMVFIAEDGLIVGIAAHTEPLSERIIQPAQPVRAVLELGAGVAAERGIEVGDRLDQPKFAAVPK